MSFRTLLRQASDPTLPIERRVDRLWAASAKFQLAGYGRMFAHLGQEVGVTDATWSSDQLTTAARLLADANSSFADYWQKERAAARLTKGTHGYKPKHLREVYETWWAEYFELESSWSADSSNSLRRATKRPDAEIEDAPPTLRRRAQAFLAGLKSGRSG